MGFLHTPKYAIVHNLSIVILWTLNWEVTIVCITDLWAVFICITCSTVVGYFLLAFNIKHIFQSSGDVS